MINATKSFLWSHFDTKVIGDATVLEPWGKLGK